MTEVKVRTSSILAVAFSVCIGVNGAEAQTVAPATPSSPTSAIYGDAETRSTPDGGLGLSVHAYEAYDDDVLVGTLGFPRLPSSSESAAGFYTGLGARLRFARSGDRGVVRSWATSALAYSPELKDLASIYHQAGLAFAAPVGRRITVHGGPFAEYSPRYSLRSFPGLPAFDPTPGLSISGPTATPGPDFDYTSIRRNTQRYGASVGTNVYVTNRATLGLDYGYAQVASEGLTDMQVRGAAAHFGFKLTRNAWLMTGYSRQTSWYEGLEPRTRSTGSIDIGVHFEKPLSISRKTILRFATGAASTGHNRNFLGVQAVGSASLVHHLGRSWSIAADYSRGLGYIEGFTEPVFSDSAGAGVGGLISRRVEFSAGTRYFTGDFTRGFGRSAAAARAFETYGAWTRIRTGLTRTLAAYAEYRFYHYDLTDTAMRPIGAPDRFGRNSVQVGLSLWIPLAGRTNGRG
jgi:hypothetical protein